MRRLIKAPAPLAAALLLAACASTPEAPRAPQPVPLAPKPLGDLLGLTSGEIIQRFGQPALQIREGSGLKLQFRGRCILDAYLYPPTAVAGPERVAHVDTRLASGADTDQRACIAALQAG